MLVPIANPVECVEQSKTEAVGLLGDFNKAELL